MKAPPKAMNISPAQKSLPFVIFITPSTTPAAYSATAYQAGIAPLSTFFTIQVNHQLGTGHAQPLRQHQNQLHQNLRPQDRLLQDYARQFLPRQHGEKAAFCRDAS